MSVRPAKMPKLRVVSDGIGGSINVPTGNAQALHAYLRGHRVQSSPPQPSSSGFDNIQLPRGVDVKAVQALLRLWA